jgi:uncharacterized membrane protein
MQDPNNPGGDWQEVPNTPPTSPDPVATNAPPPNYQQPPYQASPQPAGLTPNAAGALSYLTFIPAIIFLVMEPYKRVPFIRFHAIQCLALTVVWVVVNVIMAVLASAVFLTTPNGGFGIAAIFGLIFWCVRVIFFIAWLIALYQASQGKWFKLPVIGDFALKQAQQQQL